MSKSVTGCPQCGTEMDHEHIWERYLTFSGGNYWQCPLCGYWLNKAYLCGVAESGSHDVLELNFDNEDGWPCR